MGNHFEPLEVKENGNIVRVWKLIVPSVRQQKKNGKWLDDGISDVLRRDR